MVTYAQDEFNSYFRLWEDELVDGQNYSPDWTQYRSPTAVKLVRERAASYGNLPAVSLFIRAFNELREAGTIRTIRAARQVEPERPVLTAAEYNRIPARVIVRRYRSEPDFKSAVDLLIQRGLI